MSYKTGNYSAFYVSEPFNESSLGAHATHDFVYYNMLRAWKGKDHDFPFNDSHDKNYNVRDGSSWDSTLKPRLRDRLNKSKNIIFFLSSITKNSRALREEIEYGITTCDLPIIVIYPDYEDPKDLLNSSKGDLNNNIKTLWTQLPAFNNNKYKIPVLHIPLKRVYIEAALINNDFMVNTKTKAEDYFYK